MHTFQEQKNRCFTLDHSPKYPSCSKLVQQIICKSPNSGPPVICYDTLQITGLTVPAIPQPFLQKLPPMGEHPVLVWAFVFLKTILKSVRYAYLAATKQTQVLYLAGF